MFGMHLIFALIISDYYPRDLTDKSEPTYRIEFVHEFECLGPSVCVGDASSSSPGGPSLSVCAIRGDEFRLRNINLS